MQFFWSGLLLAGLTIRDEPPAGDDGESGDPGSSAETKKTDTSEHMVSKSRLDEVLKKFRESEKARKDLEAQTRQAEETKLAEQQQFKELAERAATERDTLKAQLEASQAQLRERDRRESFYAAAGKAGVPADALQDAYRLADWPEGEEVPDMTAFVKDLVAAKPRLVTLLPTAPDLNTQGGTGPGPGKGKEPPPVDAYYTPTGSSLRV